MYRFVRGKEGERRVRMRCAHQIWYFPKKVRKRGPCAAAASPAFPALPSCHNTILAHPIPPSLTTQDIQQACAQGSWDQTCCQCIVSHESGGNANAMNYNDNGSFDVGVWQINDVNWAWYAPLLLLPLLILFCSFLFCALLFSSAIYSSPMTTTLLVTELTRLCTSPKFFLLFISSSFPVSLLVFWLFLRILINTCFSNGGSAPCDPAANFKCALAVYSAYDHPKSPLLYVLTLSFVSLFSSFLV